MLALTALYSLGQPGRNSKWLQRLLLWNECSSFLSFGEWSQPVLVPVPETGSILSDRFLQPIPTSSPTEVRDLLHLQQLPPQVSLQVF